MKRPGIDVDDDQAFEAYLRQALPRVLEKGEGPDQLYRSLEQRLLAERRPGAGLRRFRPNRLIGGLAGALAAALVATLVARQKPVEPLILSGPGVVRVTSPHRHVVLQTARGARIGTAEVHGPATLEVERGLAPQIRIHSGYLRLTAKEPSLVHVSDVRLQLGSGAELLLEVVPPRPTKGDAMRPLWLVPISAVSGSAMTLAFLTIRGPVSVGDANAASTGPSSSRDVVVMSARSREPRDDDRRRLAMMESKVAALQSENNQLAAELAHKKGVNVNYVLEHLSLIKKRPGGGFASPKELTDLLVSLKGLGPAGIEAMVGLLQSRDAKDRILAARLLEGLGASGAIPDLKQMALKDEDKMAAAMASHAIAMADDPAAVAALREIQATNRSPESQVNALYGLCRQGDPTALADALTFMRDPSRPEYARRALGSSLAMLGEPAAFPIVQEMVRQSADKPNALMAAIDYYKSIGTAEAAEEIGKLRAAPGVDQAVRDAAAKAAASMSP
jgi:HEAT repeat protein